MNATDYADKIVRGFLEEITDQVFLYIQQDRSRMKEYQAMVDQEGSPDTIHQLIGKKVKEQFGLDNGPEPQKQTNPRSPLIGSYTKHKPK